VPQQRPNRRSRKRRNPGAAPRAVASQRREQRVEREVASERQRRREQSTLRTYGERPPGPFGGVPVSETAILFGIIALVVWLFSRGTLLLVIGLVLCALAVMEITAREHLSGYRSHTTLLAAIPSVAIGIAVVSAIGTRRDRAPVLIAVAGPLFGLLVWFLRRRFQVARQARVTRLPRG
jgi:hypothetical protein